MKLRTTALSGYKLFSAGNDCNGGHIYSTVDEALRQAARYTRLNPQSVVTMREHPGGKVRAVASNGKAFFVTNCDRCYGTGFDLSRQEFCGRCSGNGHIADDVASARG